jgi:hypothetical protein
VGVRFVVGSQPVGDITKLTVGTIVNAMQPIRANIFLLYEGGIPFGAVVVVVGQRPLRATLPKEHCEILTKFLWTSSRPSSRTSRHF